MVGAIPEQVLEIAFDGEGLDQSVDEPCLLGRAEQDGTGPRLSGPRPADSVEQLLKARVSGPLLRGRLDEPIQFAPAVRPLDQIKDRLAEALVLGDMVESRPRLRADEHGEFVVIERVDECLVNCPELDALGGPGIRRSVL